MVCGLVSKTPIGRATEVEMSWNRSGCFLLAKQSGAVDVTGKSYYGTSKLHLIQVSVAAGQKEPVELGQVRSVATNVQFWSWNAVQNNSFFVGHGPLPCVMEVWNAVACKPSIKLGEERRNFLRCCHSLPLPPATEPGSKPDRRAKLGLNMAVIGGFGNLPGDVEVWDISKQEIIGLTKLPWTVDLSFSPDAYWLLASTTTPRLRVDNCLKIVRVNGEPVLEKAFDELYQADWRPVPVQHARALSPGRGVYKPKANNTLEGLFKTKKETSSGLFGRVMTGTNEKRSLTATQLGSNATTQTKPARTVPGMVPGMTIPANNNKGIDEVGNDWARMSEMQLAKQAVKLNRQLHRAYDISQKAAIKAQLDAITAECVRRRSQSS
ncbi:eukaryotic translation initiation factor 2A [Gregarina niphandrodes]|uniref:Eukaryotic translation initiation factor 2A n=2 Tax=Gregarina niphandrodes TaxID=110365 RepID=A0A023B3M7_GRENI|nr:eukaryotic translation initiation factor 2A [Gregarina niphandrodes]EZG55468.1 eukaryotic translation initiation factor 2A [Gregarina niphandrodes]|eukprot:XP_011131544.1 eukaryotic translation initiation factor 2A [Gregarina niphandrodes]